MDTVKKKYWNKEHMVVKVWGRFCKTSRSSTSSNGGCVAKVLAPEGCFFVCVGPQRQRFVVKTKIANHPLFRMLLEAAELEYGFRTEGPLLLPCDVDLFHQVLAEIDDGGDREMSLICSFGCCPCCRSTSSANKGYGSYQALTPS